MKNKIYYKIVDKIGDDYFYLFHGLNKNKKIILDKWISADIKIVSDGKGTKYLSGFHVMESLEEAELYLTKFKNVKNKSIIKVMVDGIRKKEHSRSNVYLANKIKVIK